MDFKRNLVVVSHNYRNFVKDQVEIVAPYFNNIYALIRHNPIAEISNYCSFNYLNQRKKKSIIDLKNKPLNINVIPTPVFYFPTDAQYKKLGEKHLKSVNNIIQKNNIQMDLVHSHFVWSAGYVGTKLKEKHDVPFIVTAHGYDIYDLPFRDNEWKEKIKYVLESANHIITVSNSNLQCIKKLNVRVPIKVIPNGFDGDMFYPRDTKICRKTLNLPLNKKIILSVGNLVEIKGHKYLIEAMNEIAKHRNDVFCIMVGDGKIKNELIKQIKTLNLEKYVMLVGAKSHDEIPTWMNACDLFVLPSLRESFGVVQIEAMACGKPVVATYNGGSEEIITSEDIGYLVANRNSYDLAEKIIMALDNDWDYKKIFDFASSFEWKDVAKDILKIYDSLLK